MTKSNEILLHLDATYREFFNKIKSHISTGKVRAAVTLNKEVIHMYWKIGKDLIEKGEMTNWGDKLLEQVSHDLRTDFPEMKGFSITNLKYMRVLALLCQTQLKTDPLFKKRNLILTHPNFSIFITLAYHCK